MTDWFARPVLHVTDVEASLRFYVDRLGFTSPWRYDEDGKVRVAQVERQGCALILSDHVAGEDWQGADVHFHERRRARPRSPRWTRCARNSRLRASR